MQTPKQPSWAQRVGGSAPASTAAPVGRVAVTGHTTLGGSAPAVVSIVPEKAKTIASYIKSTDGAPKAGYVGGREFENNERLLPDGNYWEYDVNAFKRGVSRGTERIVISEDWRFYYTKDHYKSFTEFFIP